MSQVRARLEGLGGLNAAKAATRARTGELTQQQNDAVVEMLDLFGKVKESAKLAFAGQDVKLRQEFLIGVNEPNDLASVLERAKTVAASAKSEANPEALREKGGWLPTDTALLDDAIKRTGDIDKSQQSSQQVAIAGTDDRNTAANTLYDEVLKIQHAADIQWPERKGDNRGIRDSFRLGSFPSSGGAEGDKSAPRPDPSPAPPVPPK
jgi:hypothetical protein